MNWTIKDLTFILYNNRSVNGVVKNFLPKLNPLVLTKIESNLDKCKSRWGLDNKMVEVDLNEFDLSSEDITVTLEELKRLSPIIRENLGKFSQSEKSFLDNRGITDNIITKWNILGLSNIKNLNDLQILGATCHPTLKKFLDDGIEWGGIIIPLFDQNGDLINCAIRKINSHKSLKYSLACPDVPVWGLSDIELGEEVSICEGLFDFMALRDMGKVALSCSSAMWSGIQLYEVIEKRPKKISIYSDNDRVGLKTSAILKEFFEQYHIECEILVSQFSKDPAEHHFELGLSLNDFKKITIDSTMIEELSDNFNFIEYLKMRTW